MLSVDASQRISIRDIVQHKWVRMGPEDKEFESLICESLSPPETILNQMCNEVVLDHMQSVGLDRDKAKEVSKGMIYLQWSEGM